MNGCTIFNNKLDAYCIDSDQKGKFIITASSRTMTLHYPTITENCSSCHTKNIKETNVDILRLNHFDLSELKVAFTNVSDLNVSKITESDIICIYSKSETGRKISDLDWCMDNDNLIITTSNDNRGYVWDLRTKNPVSWFSSLSKMKHGKFKKSNIGEKQYYVAFSESTNIKLFDMRYPEKAYKNIYAHDNIINDLQWDNLDNDIIITTSDDYSIRYWDCNNFDFPIHELKSSLLPAKQFINSPCGKFFTTITDLYFNQKILSPSYTIWRRPGDNSIFSKDFVDEKIRGGVWQYGDELMSELYFFYITCSGKFCRRTLNSCHLGTEIESILHAPIIQKNTDIEIDERITRYDSETLNSECFILSKEQITNFIQENNSLNITETKDISLPKEIAVVNEYSRFIKIPYFDDNLLNELEGLKNISTLELQAAEVNFSRAAVMIIYENIKVSFKLVMEIRFHCDFINNGNIFISIYEKDCPLTTKEAEEFLERLQLECNIQKTLPKNKKFIEKMYEKKKFKKKNSCGNNINQVNYKNVTFLSLVVRQIPKIIKEMNVLQEHFTNQSDNNFCYTDSDEDVYNFETVQSTNVNIKLLKNLSNSTHSVLDKIDHRVLTATFPFNYNPNEYDKKICLPKKFGAHFCKSGHFITFGINSTYQALIITEKIDKNDKLNGKSITCGTKFRNQKGNKLHVFHVNPRDKLPKFRSMFKSLHHFREHLKKQFEKYILAFTWEKHDITAYHLKLRKYIDMKEKNEENKDEYLHTTNSNKDLYNSLKQCYPFKSHGKVLYELKESLSINDVNKILLQKNDSLILIKDHEKEKHINNCENNCIHLIDNDIIQILKHIESRMFLNNDQIMNIWNEMKIELLKIMNQYTKGFKNEFTTEDKYKLAPLKFILQHFIQSSDYHSVTLLAIILSRICILKTKNLPLSSGEKGITLPLSTPFRASYLSNYGYYRALVYYNLAIKYDIESVLTHYQQKYENIICIEKEESSKYFVNYYDFPILINYFISQYTNSGKLIYKKYAINDIIEIYNHHIDKCEKIKYSLDDTLLHYMNVMQNVYCKAIYRMGNFNKFAEFNKFQSNLSYIIESKRASSSRIDEEFIQIRCTICNLYCKGLVSICFLCGHGGHYLHINEWFQQQKRCPAGCGCKCMMNISKNK
uniref:WD_REPEATS_REGION domain-containing protein n=1 Tax=Strongyloides stercoralis TaxID=6248 RepID=A0A0K0EL97_STRER